LAGAAPDDSRERRVEKESDSAQDGCSDLVLRQRAGGKVRAPQVQTRDAILERKENDTVEAREMGEEGRDEGAQRGERGKKGYAQQAGVSVSMYLLCVYAGAG
jgi:hypothetical protein